MFMWIDFFFVLQLSWLVYPIFFTVRMYVYFSLSCIQNLLIYMDINLLLFFLFLVFTALSFFDIFATKMEILLFLIDGLIG